MNVLTPDLIYWPRPRVCFVGYGRHGKDVAAAALHNFGPFRAAGSTSWHAVPLMAHRLGTTQQDAWDNRHQNRERWKQYCDEFRAEDPLALIRLALKHGNVLSGIRDQVEIDAAIHEKVFDEIVWIHRPGYPVDSTVTFGPERASQILSNGSTLEDFQAQIRNWAESRFNLSVV